jgi:hypothetical protein
MAEALEAIKAWGLRVALVELEQALAFFDRVRQSSDEERCAVGADHWDWLEQAARRVVEASR